MSQVVVISENATREGYEARLESTQGEGVTIGAALDRLLDQLEEPGAPLLLVRQNRPDSFFSQQHFERLQELQAKLKLAPASLTAFEKDELQHLIAQEFRATIQRTDILVSSTAT